VDWPLLAGVVQLLLQWQLKWLLLPTSHQCCLLLLRLLSWLDVLLLCLLHRQLLRHRLWTACRSCCLAHLLACLLIILQLMLQRELSTCLLLLLLLVACCCWAFPKVCSGFWPTLRMGVRLLLNTASGPCCGFVALHASRPL
jgi:hypothetical protein